MSGKMKNELYLLLSWSKHVKKKVEKKNPPSFTKEISITVDMVDDQWLLENLIHILSQSLDISESFERCPLKHLNFY